MITTLLGAYLLLGVITFLFVSVYGKGQVNTSMTTIYALFWPIFWVIVLFVLIKDNVFGSGR